MVLLCLAAATNAFAQGGTGTLTGTVVDGTGAAIPGATVTATELNTGTERMVVSDDTGVFRMAALNPGPYVIKIELASFKPLSVADINLLSSEIRDLGKLALEVGGITETVSVTSEVTPVQVADSSRRSTITVDDLANIQMKGRDVFGLLAILPGVQDTNLNRDFAQWRSAISITINGMPSQNKDVRVDGLNIVDEGGCGTAFVNLNMDAIGEVQVIANGYTAENGRNNGGLISVVTKSGGSALKASGWYNGRRDQFNENDYFRKAAGQAKPLYRVNISGYSVGGPVVIPGLVDSRSGKGGSKKFYFFALAGIHRRCAADDDQPRQHADGARVRRRLLADPSDGRNHSADHRSESPVQQFPGNIIPADRINPLGQKMLRLLPQANGILDPRVGSGVDVEFDLRPDAGARPHEPRAARRCAC